tara:strand:- start:1438 stop:2466 length:1029 start_codon:yes stop_codon:yes gene_type:complete
MVFDKINIYLFFQIVKYFVLILFIFLSVAWLLQITRLFTISNFLYIEIFDIILLSLYLIPNLMTVILPFILIFGLLLCFNKLKRDNELISILSLGLGLKPFKITLISFCLIILSFFILLNFYFAPKIYGIYKLKEFEIRNTLDFDKMSFSNFLNLDTKTILDFNKKDNEYVDIFINFIDDNENIVYAKKGSIFSDNNQYNFKLTDGFKISINESEQLEKLEFKNYVLKIDYKNLNNNQVIDRNTFTIFDDYNSKDYLNISFKILDIFLIIYVILFFYNNNLKEINFNTKNNIYFACSSICVLLLNQILKNSQVTIYNYIFPIFGVILLSIIITNFKKKYEQN